MYEGGRTIAPDDYIRSQTKDVTAAAIAPERVCDEMEVFEHFKIEIHGSASTGAHGGRTCKRVEHFDGTN